MDHRRAEAQRPLRHCELVAGGFEATRDCQAAWHANHGVAMRPQVMAAHFRLSCPNRGKFDAEMPPGFALKLFATAETTVGTHPYRLKPGLAGGDLSQGNTALQIAPIGAEVFKMERRNHFRAGVYGNVCLLFSVDTSDLADKLRKLKTVVKSGGSTFFPTLNDFAEASPPRPVSNGRLERFPAAWGAPSEALGLYETFGTARISPADQANFRFCRRIRRPERRSAAGAFRHRPGCPWTAVHGFRGRVAVFHSWWSGAAHPLQNHRGTDREDHRPTQALAGRRRHEEMAR